jgi:hypothetical protein
MVTTGTDAPTTPAMAMEMEMEMATATALVWATLATTSSTWRHHHQHGAAPVEVRRARSVPTKTTTRADQKALCAVSSASDRRPAVAQAMETKTPAADWMGTGWESESETAQRARPLGASWLLALVEASATSEQDERDSAMADGDCRQALAGKELDTK